MTVTHRILILGLGLMMGSCAREDASSCIADWSADRASVNAEFADGEGSPLSDSQKANFTGLEFYPGDAGFCVQAGFAESDDREVFDMPTFNEASIPFREYGVFTFSLDGNDHSLTGYQRMDLPENRRQWVLVPFKDATNGRETYGGGRYLQIDLPIDSSTVIDLNRASNPWCAYDPRYLCPVPPARNWLKLHIAAGEKAFKTGAADST